MMKKLLKYIPTLALAYICLFNVNQVFAATPPTLVQYVTTGYAAVSAATNSTTTQSFTVQSADVLIATAVCEDDGICNNTSPSVAIVISSTPSLTWTAQQTQILVNNVSETISSAVANTNGSMTVTATKNTASATHWGVSVWDYRNSGGVGSCVKALGSGAPTVNITTAADSAITVVDGDWAAVTGASTGRTGAGTFTKDEDRAGDGSSYGVHIGHNADFVAGGTVAVGYTAPTGQTYTLMACEVKAASTVVNTVPSTRAWWSNGFTALTGFIFK